MEQLYIEVLYTIKYKVGLSSNQTSQYQEELYSYAQRAFKVSNDVHRRYLSIASEEKVSSLLGAILLCARAGAISFMTCFCRLLGS